MATPKENRPKDDRQSSPARWGFALLMMVTIAFRFLALDIKPPHFDEGINGYFVLSIWRDGFYSYDPTNFHGPLYFYLCHLAEVLFGRGVDSFRLMNATIAVALVCAVFQFRRFFGNVAVLAAWFIAVSPAFVFYGRYAIHESLFVLGQVLFVYGRFVWMARPRREAIFSMALGAIIMVTTKETFFIFFGTWLIAEAMIAGIERLESPREPWSLFSELDPAEKKRVVTDIFVAVGLVLLIIAAFFTGFFEHAKGGTDFFRAFRFWSNTGAAGNGHEKSFFYWLSLMARYEWPLLIGFVAAVGGVIFLRVDQRRLRILMLFGFGHWLAYSLIPYKTPWLILNFWPLAFVKFAPPRRRLTARLSVLALVLILAISSFFAWRLNFQRPTDPQEPYVYVQTTDDYSKVLGVLNRQTKINPEIRNISIVVMLKDPWPLPYDLSLFPYLRYAKLEDVDRDPKILSEAGLVVIDGSILEGLRRVFPKRFARLSFKIRDAYEAGWALFDMEKFKESLPPEADGESAAP